MACTNFECWFSIFISVIIMYFQFMVLSIIPMHLNYTDKLGPIKQGYDGSALNKESAIMESEFTAIPPIIRASNMHNYIRQVRQQAAKGVFHNYVDSK